MSSSFPTGDNQADRPPGHHDTANLVFPKLGGFYSVAEPISYTLLRVWFSVSILTHGVPKLLRLPHGKAPDAFVAVATVLEKKIHAPAPYAVATMIMLIETLGAVMLLLGLGTRVIAGTMAIMMLVISFSVHYPHWIWNEGGMEYPMMLAAVAGALSLRGGGKYSLDRAIGREI